MRESFVWLGMRRAMERFVQSCPLGAVYYKGPGQSIRGQYTEFLRIAKDVLQRSQLSLAPTDPRIRHEARSYVSDLSRVLEWRYRRINERLGNAVSRRRRVALNFVGKLKIVNYIVSLSPRREISHRCCKTPWRSQDSWK